MSGLLKNKDGRQGARNHSHCINLIPKEIKERVEYNETAEHEKLPCRAKGFRGSRRARGQVIHRCLGLTLIRKLWLRKESQLWNRKLGTFLGKGSVWKRKQRIRKRSQRVKIHLEGKPNRPKNWFTMTQPTGDRGWKPECEILIMANWFWSLRKHIWGKEKVCG